VSPIIYTSDDFADGGDAKKRSKEKLNIVRQLFKLLDNLTDDVDDDYTGTSSIRVIRKIL
jgi:hypothetical protein